MLSQNVTDVVWGKWPMARNPDRSWWERHTSIKPFWSQVMAAWTAGGITNSKQVCILLHDHDEDFKNGEVFMPLPVVWLRLMSPVYSCLCTPDKLKLSIEIVIL